MLTHADVCRTVAHLLYVRGCGVRAEVQQVLNLLLLLLVQKCKYCRNVRGCGVRAEVQQVLNLLAVLLLLLVQKYKYCRSSFT
jgi:hypothetical protein